MGKTDKSGKKGPKTAVSTKLGVTFATMLVLTIIIALCIAFSFGYGMIRDLIDTSMKNEVSADAGQINRDLNATFYYLNGVADAVEQNTYANNMELHRYLDGTVGRYELIPTGAYLALDDGTFMYPADPSFEDGFDAKSKAWYTEAMGYTNSWFYFYDVPYFDTVTNELCATVQRKVTLKDGRVGVFDADLMMGNVQNVLNEVKLYDSGRAMMVTTDGLILSYEDLSMCGTNIADYPDDVFLNGISQILTAEDGEIAHIKANGTYYVTSSTVGGTNWKVIIYAKESEVLKAVFNLAIFLVIFTVVAVIVVLLIMLQILNKTIKKPVTSLTNNIEKIAGGDFTVEVTSKGNDEIAYMNSAMGDFIHGMRQSLTEIKETTSKLLQDAQNSKDTAESLETAAVEQSTSMNQIKGNVENMSNSVTEVAESATTLAQAITDVTEGEKQIETAMTALVEKADAGQHDMKTVAEGMDDVVASMNDMAEAVKGVDEAAEKITQIVDMINSISSQTNLLSLNASIEAARAGEAGKGFAVVATEIGGLAMNSAEATNQIVEIIREMSSRVKLLSEKSEHNTTLINNSAEYVSAAATTFQEITSELSSATNTLEDMAAQMVKVNDVATNMASVSEEQSAATQEISVNVDAVTRAAQGVADSSETVSSAANSVAEAVDAINQNLEQFTIE